MKLLESIAAVFLLFVAALSVTLYESPTHAPLVDRQEVERSFGLPQ